MTLLERIRIHSERLPLDMQQEILDFIEFLDARWQRGQASESTPAPQGSCLDLAEQQGLVGSIKNAPGDLSTNPIHLRDYGT